MEYVFVTRLHGVTSRETTLLGFIVVRVHCCQSLKTDSARYNSEAVEV
jgi:hypothetical protein